MKLLSLKLVLAMFALLFVAQGALAQGEETVTETVKETATETVSETGTVSEAVTETETVSLAEPQDIEIKPGTDFDWIMLKSGEWLKGSIDIMRGGKIEFDSDEMGLQTLDFGDVHEVRAIHVHTYITNDYDEYIGPGLVDKENVTVETDKGIVTFPRSELLSIVPGKPKEKNWWSWRLGFGISLNKGNADNVTYNGDTTIKREDYYTRMVLTYDGTFGKANGVRNANRQFGTAALDVFVHERIYIQAVSAGFLYDEFQNTQFRATPGAGIGFHLVIEPKVDWDFETGAGYQYLKNITTGAGATNPQNDAFVFFRTFADFDITGDIELILDWRTNLVVTNTGLTNHVGKANFSFDLSNAIDLFTTFTYLRQERPITRADGTTPVQNDYQWVFGVALDLG